MVKISTSVGLACPMAVLAAAGLLLLAVNLVTVSAHGPAIEETIATPTFGAIDSERTIVMGIEPAPNIPAIRQTSWPDAAVVETPQLADTAVGSIQASKSPSDIDNLIGSNFPISALDGQQQYPDVIWNTTASEYLVVWMDQRSSTLDRIYGQRLGSSGNLLGSDFAIAMQPHLHRFPAVARNTAANEYLVIWDDRRSDTDYDVYGQRLTSSGALAGAEFAIARTVADQSLPAIAWNATANEYLVLWQDLRNGVDDIFGQRVASNGQLLGSNFAISTAANRQNYADVVWNAAANEYLVVWRDTRSGAGGIYAQRVSGSGTLRGGDFAVATGSQMFPDVAWNSTTNEYLVVWEDSRNGSTPDIYGQRVGANGTLLGSNFAVNVAADRQYYPNVVWNPQRNEYLVTWEDRRSGTNYDIYAQRVAGGGALVGDSFGVSTTVNDQRSSVAALNTAADQYLVVFMESHGPYDIYGQRVSGIPTPPTLTPTPTRTGTPTPSPTYTSTSTSTPTPTVTQTPTSTPRPARRYLPQVMHRWHPLPRTPELQHITAPSASPSYIIRWSAADWATSYVLQRATNAGFADATQVYAGTTTSTNIASQGIASYYYRVKARNQWGDSPWSNVQSVEVRWEQEPNYPVSLANGPLVSGLDYYGYPNDAQDYFTFQTISRGQITVDLTNHTDQHVQLLLYQPAGNLVAQVYQSPYHLVYTGDPGAYYVQIYSTGSFNSTSPYTLRAIFP